MNSNLLPISLSDLAIKQLKKIQRTDQNLYSKVTAAITEIRKDPTVGQAKRGDLKGYWCLDVNHLRTNYELCYTLAEDETGELVVLIMMGPRENFYDDLKRYLGIKKR